MKVHSIFESISGEGGGLVQGTWCTFIRLQGCNLRCEYCDTIDGQHALAGKEMSISEILDQVKCRNVIITGGEPLFQNISALLVRLVKRHVIQVETNGTLPPPSEVSLACWVVDIKCPSSGMHMKMPSMKQFIEWWDRENVFIKFVIDFGSEEDIRFMLQRVEELDDSSFWPQRILISPVNADGHLLQHVVEQIRKQHRTLLDEITFSFQLHKLINVP